MPREKGGLPHEREIGVLGDEGWYGGATLSDRSSSGWLRIEKQGSAHGAALFSWQSTRYLGGAVVQLSLGGDSGVDGERWCGDAKVIGT